ncbi:MAG: rod shape-determining protein [Weeksellaceae bacterium]
MKSLFQKLTSFQVPFFTPFKVYIDIGTSNTRVAIQQKGVVLREPTFLGYNSRIKEYIFFGTEAKTIVGKTPEFIQIIRPIVNSILYDFDAAVAYLQYCGSKAIQPYLAEHKILKPPIYVVSAVTSIATEIERKALEESLQKVEANNVIVIEKSLATAAGCGYDIFSHEPKLIIDMGGGLIELSIISGGGVVSQKTLKTAGEHMNKLIANYTYLKHGIVLGESTCENLKIQLLNFDTEEKVIPVRGKSLETGLPKSIKLKTSDVREALQSQFHLIIDAAKELIELSAPEVADAIFKDGIALTGNMAAIPGIEQYFSQELQIDCYVVEHFADATIYGMMKLDEKADTMYKISGIQ